LIAIANRIIFGLHQRPKRFAIGSYKRKHVWEDGDREKIISGSGRIDSGALHEPVCWLV
jgi:hypothetical protein